MKILFVILAGLFVMISSCNLVDNSSEAISARTIDISIESSSISKFSSISFTNALGSTTTYTNTAVPLYVSYTIYKDTGNKMFSVSASAYVEASNNYHVNGGSITCTITDRSSGKTITVHDSAPGSESLGCSAYYSFYY